MKALVHIAPQLPPAIDGVGDYCWNLWKYWPTPEPHWTFLVTRGAAETVILWREINAHEFDLNGGSLRSALEETDSDTVILHYVGYGYQPKGAPLWLPGALAAWKRADPRRRLVVMFHEMYARSSPLRSPFWVAPFARWIIRRLVELSDAWVTSCDRYFRELTSEFGAAAARGCIIPIGSNIPLVWAGAERAEGARNPKLRLLVFGLAKTRLWALGRHGRLLRTLAQAGLLESVTLLGKHPAPPDEAAAQRLAGALPGNVRWRKRFDLAGCDVSRELARHDIGLLANEPDILTKSGVFAALATHGVIPFVAGRAGCSLPPAFQGAVLVNDETAESLDASLKLLQNPAALQERRARLLALGQSQLAWPRITRSWNAVVGKILEERTRPRSVSEAAPSSEAEWEVSAPVGGA